MSRVLVTLIVLFLVAGCARQQVRSLESERLSKQETIAGTFGAVGPRLPSGLRALASFERGDNDLLINVVDVGGGLCVIGAAPGGYAFLIDAGHWSGRRCLLAAKALVQDQGFTLVILSHNDSDHLGDLADMADELEIQTLVWTARVPVACRASLRARGCAATYGKSIEAIGRLAATGTSIISLKYTPLEPGTTYLLGDVEVQLVAGWHESPWEGELGIAEAANAVSIVTRVVYGGNAVLVMGDSIGRPGGRGSCAAAEQYIAGNSSEIPIAADVLVASHHGADNGSANCLIEAVAPTYVVFAAGNSHEHPRQATADRFLSFGVPPRHIFRTDRGSTEGDNNPGGTREWIDGMTPRCGDAPGDDDVLILMPAFGSVQVAYRDELDICDQ